LLSELLWQLDSGELNFGKYHKGEKSDMTKWIIIPLLLCLLNFYVNTLSASEPNILEISLDPIDPKPMSTINFTAKIESDDDIERVRIIVTECMEGLCSVFGYNESLDKTTDNSYEGQVLLTRNDAAQIKYHIEIYYNGTRYISNTSFYNLNTTGFNYIGEDKEKQESTPGFELVLILLSIVLCLYLSKRKL